jgi:hypothetical protein
MEQVRIQNGRLFSDMPISPQRQAGFISLVEVFIREVAFRYV